MTSVWVIIMLQWWKPMEDKYSTNMETFNECCMIALLYTMMMFSDFVGEPEMRSFLGIWYIGTVCAFAAVHLSIMLAVMCKDLHRRYKRWSILRN